MPRKTFTDASQDIFKIKLAKVSYYLIAIEKLHNKFSSEHPKMLYEIQPDGYSFAQIYHDKTKIASILANDVSKGVYEFSPVTIREVKIEKKIRRIFSYSIFDRIVHVAIFHMLAPDIQPLFSSNVYSYIRGRGRIDAVKSFLKYIRNHKLRHTHIQNRGLFVYRFDIKSYGESIPVTPQSLIWSSFSELFSNAYFRTQSELEKKIFSSLIRPQILSEGGLYENMVGIPDGSPITSLLLNTYVLCLDRYIESITGGFYARYGDDVLFAHNDQAVFKETCKEIKLKLDLLCLKTNQEKSKFIFFNAAGRGQDEIDGSTVIEYLGMRINFDGTMSLKNDKVSELMSDIRKRVQLTLNQIHNFYSEEEKGILVCKLINEILDPANPLSATNIDYLLRLVNDRSQLKDIDYRIARLVLSLITGDASVKKFRSVPYKKLREDWKLVSLEYNRNKR
jgi:retron-type reverse transcriptase